MKALILFLFGLFTLAHGNAPFTTSLKVTKHAIRGENVAVLVTFVGKMKNSCVSVRVSMASSRYYLRKTRKSISFCLCKRRRIRVLFIIRPLKIGIIPVNVVFTTLSQNVCRKNYKLHNASISFRSNIEKNFMVVQEGIKGSYVLSEFFCGEYEKDFELKVPKYLVPGSLNSKIRVSGEFIRSNIAIDHLIDLPTGSGEQNVLRFVPHIYYMKYLQSLNLLTNETKEKYTNLAQAGFTKQLTYKREDGSYSDFGEKDDVGSTWLTAFVLKSYFLAKKWINFKIKEIQAPRNWLLNHQDNSTGCFNIIGKLHNKAMAGSSNPTATLTAYVLDALIKAGLDRKGMVATKAWSCIADAVGEISDTYSLSIITHALLHFKNETQRAVYLNAKEKLFKEMKEIVRFDCQYAMEGELVSSNDDIFKNISHVRHIKYTSKNAFDIIKPNPDGEDEIMLNATVNLETCTGKDNRNDAFKYKINRCVLFYPDTNYVLKKEKCLFYHNLWWFEEPKTLDEMKENESWYYQARSVDIEQTAYAMMITLRDRKEFNQDFPTLMGKWLLKQRNSLGGWSSSQDTILALEGLSMLNSQYRKWGLFDGIKRGFNGTMGAVNVTNNDNFAHTFYIDDNNYSDVQSVENAPVPSTTKASWEWEDNKCALVEAVVDYYVYAERPKESKHFMLQYLIASLPGRVWALKPCLSQRLRICVLSLKGETNMVLVEVEIPSGFEANPERFVDNYAMEGVKNIEVVNGGKVVVYFDQLNAVTRCIDLYLDQKAIVMSRKRVPIKVYDYYDKEKSETVFYEFDREDCKGRRGIVTK